MSEQYLALVRVAYDGWTSGGPEGIRPFLADDIELDDPPQFPDASIHGGIETAMARFREWREALGELPVEIEELSRKGDEVLVVMKVQIEGAGSGIVLNQEIAHLVTVTGGKVARMRVFLNRADALAATE